jgi:RNA polymerase sigma-70 factor (ECF subfamily)
MLDFRELYDSYASEVYRFALWLTGDCLDAEDITSETFVRAWAHNDNIRTETLKAYLFAIARNTHLERRRKRRREVDFDDTHTDRAPGPDRVAEARLELARLRSLLQTWPEIDRAALVLRVQHELPYAEVARVLGISVTAAKVKVHRTRKKLLVALADREVS